MVFRQARKQHNKRKQPEMKKLTLSIAALCVIACAAICQAKNRSEVCFFATATTNATDVSVNTGVYDGEYATFDTVCLSIPAAQTGTVTIAVLRGDTWQTLHTASLTNTTASSAVSTVDMSDVPVNGRLKYTFKQARASTNVWSAISFFKDIN